DRRHGRLEAVLNFPAPSRLAEIRNDEAEAARERLHALTAQVGHRLRSVLTQRRRVGKAREKIHGEAAVARSDVENFDRGVLLIRQRRPERGESLLPVGLSPLLPLRPLGDVVLRIPVVMMPWVGYLGHARAPYC